MVYISGSPNMWHLLPLFLASLMQNGYENATEDDGAEVGRRLPRCWLNKNNGTARDMLAATERRLMLAGCASSCC